MYGILYCVFNYQFYNQKSKTMNSYKNSPAFPPQLMLDNFQRLVAPVPGLDKLEIFCLALYPVYQKMAWESTGLSNDWAVRQTIEAATAILDKLESMKPTDQTNLKIAE
jgi:hypothetical protein